MHASRNAVLRALALAAGLACASPSFARDRAQPHWSFDPAQVVKLGPRILQRAPDAALDQLLQAVAAAARKPAQLESMCAVLAPEARHDLAALNDVALGFDAPSRAGFEHATEALLAGKDGPVRAYDPQLARKALSQAAVTAAFLFDGFAAGISAEGRDAASRAARCRALGQLLETVAMRPLPERAMIARLLLHEGYARLER